MHKILLKRWSDESLKGIAFRELGDEDRWEEIYSLNELDSNELYPFNPGQIILLPTE